MIQQTDIRRIVEEYLADTAYYLVDATVSADNRIVVEIDAFDGVSIDFCAELNHHIESLLNRDVDDFELEVGSAGLTEPFKVQKQYEKNIGNEVEVLTKDGRKLSGTLINVSAENFTISQQKLVKPEGAKRKVAVQEETTFAYSDIKYTKYIIIFK